MSDGTSARGPSAARYSRLGAAARTASNTCRVFDGRLNAITSTGTSGAGAPEVDGRACGGGTNDQATPQAPRDFRHSAHFRAPVHMGFINPWEVLRQQFGFQ